jgi:hypothetical protein
MQSHVYFVLESNGGARRTDLLGHYFGLVLFSSTSPSVPEIVDEGRFLFSGGTGGCVLTPFISCALVLDRALMLRVEEKRKGFLGELLLTNQITEWLALTIEILMGFPGDEFVKFYKEGTKVLIICHKICHDRVVLRIFNR